MQHAAGLPETVRQAESATASIKAMHADRKQLAIDLVLSGLAIFSVTSLGTRRVILRTMQWSLLSKTVDDFKT